MISLIGPQAKKLQNVTCSMVNKSKSNISTLKPLNELKLLAEYFVKVYAPVWFQIKTNTTWNDGSKNFGKLIKKSRYLPAECKVIVDPVIRCKPILFIRNICFCRCCMMTREYWDKSLPEKYLKHDVHPIPKNNLVRWRATTFRNQWLYWPHRFATNLHLSHVAENFFLSFFYTERATKPKSKCSIAPWVCLERIWQEREIGH